MIFKKGALTTLLLASLFAVGSAQADTSVPNLYQVKQQLIQYHDSGDYDYAITGVDQKAAAYLLDRITTNMQLPTQQQKKLAVVFDIDETALSNYPDMKSLDFGGTQQSVAALIAKGHDAALSPSLALYKMALKHKVAVFFITGRPVSMQQTTSANLKKVGYTTWQQLIMRPNDYAKPSIVAYKSAARAQIEKSGYDIVMNIGDQNSDLAGGYADKGFKLPNPYYFLP